jgi:preprotein translocase subunit SecE
MSKKQSGATETTQAKAVSGKSSQVSGEDRSLSARFAAFKDYLILSRVELRKVSWPNWKETRTTSMVVLGFVAVMAILLGLVDLVLSGVVRLILS